MKEKIDLRLDKALDNMDKEYFEELFPLMLDDLEYILVDFKNDRNNLSEVEVFKYGIDFSKKIIKYLGKLSKMYFKLIYEMDINIINKEDYNLSMAAAGYNSLDGNIYYSNFGALISQQSDLSFLHTCLHEGRHQMQHEFYRTNNLLLFPPYMLKLLKEGLLENSLQDNKRKFYITNYKELFVENDAEIFAKNEIYNVINNLFRVYINKYYLEENDLKNLLIKINKINKLFEEKLKAELYFINDEIASKMNSSKSFACYYKLKEKTCDGLILMDKYIKSNPHLQQQYPILKLLFNENQPKDYQEIIFDKEMFKQKVSLKDQNKIDNLYNEIIALDPILTLSQILENGDYQKLTEYLDLHPTLISQYPEEMKNLSDKYGGLEYNTKK